jgi:hypothetical protein
MRGRRFAYIRRVGRGESSASSGREVPVVHRSGCSLVYWISSLKFCDPIAAQMEQLFRTQASMIDDASRKWLGELSSYLDRVETISG